MSRQIIRREDLFEYEWPSSSGNFFFVMEHISEFVGQKSSTRKQTGSFELNGRKISPEEKEFLILLGILSDIEIHLNLTAVTYKDATDMLSKKYPKFYYLYHLRKYMNHLYAFKNEKLAKNTDLKTNDDQFIMNAIENNIEYNEKLKLEQEERKCFISMYRHNVNNNQKLISQAFSKDSVVGQLYHEGGETANNTVIAKSTSIIDDIEYDTHFAYKKILQKIFHEGVDKDKVLSLLETSDSAEVFESTFCSHLRESNVLDTSECIGDCKICFEKVVVSLGDSVLCSNCKNYFHLKCAGIHRKYKNVIDSYDWRCVECKFCSKCNGRVGNMLFCDYCDRAYHQSCINLLEEPKGRWICSICGYCCSCRKRKCGSYGWVKDYIVMDNEKYYFQLHCLPCSKLLKAGKFCIVCLETFHNTKSNPCLKCTKCKKQVHNDCYDAKTKSCFLCCGIADQRIAFDFKIFM